LLSLFFLSTPTVKIPDLRVKNKLEWLRVGVVPGWEGLTE